MPDVEYLPVSIVDHRGRIASPDYCIVNPINPVDCLDADKSGADWSELNEGTIDSIAKLVITEEKVPPARQLFRMKYFYDLILIRRELAEAINGSGATGIRWIEPKDYPEV